MPEIGLEFCWWYTDAGGNGASFRRSMLLYFRYAFDIEASLNYLGRTNGAKTRYAIL